MLTVGTVRSGQWGLDALPKQGKRCCVAPGGVKSPLGKGLLRVVARSGSAPLFRLVTIVVEALFGGLS
jgi:hypothetical protein